MYCVPLHHDPGGASHAAMSTPRAFAVARPAGASVLAILNRMPLRDKIDDKIILYYCQRV